MFFLNKKILFIFIFFSLLFAQVNFVFAGPTVPFEKGLQQTGTNAGYDLVAVDKEKAQGKITSWISKVIEIVLSFLGVIFLALTIYAGFTWMTARGDAAKVTKAKDTLTSSIIGLIVVVAAYAISIFVISSF